MIESQNDNEEFKPVKNYSIQLGPSSNSNYPWRRFNRVYDSRGIVGLHKEIEDFVKYMTPTVEEHTIRLNVVKRIKSLIYSLWPKSIVEVFGSFATGFYLPTSDIDIVVSGNWNKPPLYILERALIESDISKAEQIKVLDKASVPIIKLTDQSCNIKVDISFNMKNAVRSVQMIKDFSHHYPVLSKLVIVLKQFLLQRNLNEVFNGGISSYSLILMIISFLQLHPKQDCKSSKLNLGTLLIDFFELYGRTFDYEKTAIRIKLGGSLIAKDELQKNTIEGHKPTTLCIEDPLTPGNDVGCGSYGTVYAKMEFEFAFLVLTSTLSSSNSSDTNLQSILGRIIVVSDDIINYRKWVRENNNSMMNFISVNQLKGGSEVNCVASVAASKRSEPRGNSEILSWRTHSNLGMDNNREQYFQRRNPVKFIVPHCQGPLIQNTPLLHGPLLPPPQGKCGINSKYTGAPHQNNVQRIFYGKTMLQQKVEKARYENYILSHPPMIPLYSFRSCDTIFKPVGMVSKNNHKFHQYRLSVPSADFLVAAW